VRPARSSGRRESNPHSGCKASAIAAPRARKVSRYPAASVEPLIAPLPSASISRDHSAAGGRNGAPRSHRNAARPTEPARSHGWDINRTVTARPASGRPSTQGTARGAFRRVRIIPFRRRFYGQPGRSTNNAWLPFDFAWIDHVTNCWHFRHQRDTSVDQSGRIAAEWGRRGPAPRTQDGTHRMYLRLKNTSPAWTPDRNVFDRQGISALSCRPGRGGKTSLTCASTNHVLDEPFRNCLPTCSNAGFVAADPRSGRRCAGPFRERALLTGD